jgi:deoxyuridine 5'-triphosphate nucleotidohydrolase
MISWLKENVYNCVDYVVKSSLSRIENKLTFNIVKLSNNAIIPTTAHNDDAGYDVYSTQDVIIPKRSRKLIPTGIAIEFPDDYKCYGRIAARSGLSTKASMDTGAGVIDKGYTGEINVLLINDSDEDFEVNQGMKIAQLVIERIIKPKIRMVDNLTITERNNSGFGSTGN